MAKHVFVVFTNAVDGREDEFNRWYSERHIYDIVALDGFDAAQRFELAELDPPQESPFKYLALYEVDSDDLVVARKALKAASGTASVEVSDSLARPTNALWFTALSDRVAAQE